MSKPVVPPKPICDHKCHKVGLNPWVARCPICGCSNEKYDPNAVLPDWAQEMSPRSDWSLAFEDGTRRELSQTEKELIVTLARELYDRFMMGGWEPQDSYDMIGRILVEAKVLLPLESTDVGAQDKLGPQEWMVKFVEDVQGLNRARNHVLRHKDEWADVMPSEEMLELLAKHYASRGAQDVADTRKALDGSEEKKP